MTGIQTYRSDKHASDVSGWKIYTLMFELVKMQLVTQSSVLNVLWQTILSERIAPFLSSSCRGLLGAKGLGPLFEGLQPLIIMRMGQQYSKWHMFRISAFYIEFKGVMNPNVLDVLVGVVKDSGDSWQGFWFLIMMWMGQQCPKQHMFQNSAFYIE